MMKLVKIQEDISFPPVSDFSMQSGTVQGATIGKTGDFVYVCSPKRYKLFTEDKHYLTVLEGSGHFKWKRGETDFSKGDLFAIEQVGEYEVNGNATFIVKVK